MRENFKNRVRRTMMFLNAQRPALMKDAYVYGPDSVIMDLEDAVSENQKDAARLALFNNLRSVDYGGVERIVRINGLDTPYWWEDIRASVAGGADAVRIPKCERADEVRQAELAIEAAEAEFSAEPGNTAIMAAIESPKGVLNALSICEASPRMFGVAISGGDLRVALQTKRYPSGVEMAASRGAVLLAARAAGVQCFDTVFTDLDDAEGFKAEVKMIREMGFDGKSIVHPKQIAVVHEIFTPSSREIMEAERVLSGLRENSERGVGVFIVDGRMIDVAFMKGAERTLALARAGGAYKGDLI
ncbi:MAG: HpcH/HpaI aldolase/citrate lyase family protein [Synergistaceae bacterium]|jgi:citrate lyase subunit beta/citryl-CoA lyase|nr:HpcH/HpaI aldolase/citrate lyase family protein [Synergistaceae bacterium]